MANEISTVEKNALAVSYEVMGTKVEMNLDFVKKYLVRGQSDIVSDQEIVFFMNMCKMQKLNPLTGSDCYLIKYSKQDPAQMVVGKAAYMRRAFEHPDYLCKEDGIVVQRGNQIIQKEGCCIYPGEELIGGWCRVHYARAGKERTAFKEVALSEYSKGMANWKSKPALMINKVAVSQCVREAFPKDYEGLYSEDEMVASGAIPATYEVIDEKGEVVEILDTKQITQEQRQEFMNLISENFQGNDAKNAVYKRVLEELGLKSTNTMTVGEWNKAKELVIQFAHEEDEVIDAEVVEAVAESDTESEDDGADDSEE